MTGTPPEEVLEQVKEAQRELRGLISDARQAERDLYRARDEVAIATTELLADAIKRIDAMTKDELARIAENTQANIDIRAKRVEEYFESMRLTLINLPAELQIPGVMNVHDLIEVARQIKMVQLNTPTAADKLIEGNPGVPIQMGRPKTRRGKRR